MVIKRKSAIYSVIALMLCVAVYLNWSYQRGGEEGEAMQTSQTDDNKILGESQLVDKTESGEGPLETTSGEEEQPEGETTAASDYFSQARLSRQQARDEAVSIFKQTSENPSADAQSKEQAEASIATMAENAVKEARIENLVVAKGFADCVTFINEEGVNVIVQKTENGLGEEDVAKIRDIVMSETDFAADVIKIIETA